jgi:protoporphyrinogen oxidase
MNIAVIGGGMMGMTTAYRLSQQGHQVTVFESSDQLGGLTTHHDYGSFVWDRFYHVILPSDQALIELIREIGLGDRLHWQKTLTGFYVDRQFYSISNSIEFLRFPPLNLIDKIRLAFTLLYGSRVKNWKQLEQIRAEDWLKRLSGKGTYEKMWKPLLRAKLGENYQRVSAVFIWAYITRLFSARDSSLKKEELGYVEGGYKTVFDRLALLIQSNGGAIHTDVAVESIGTRPGGGLWVEHSGSKDHFDKVFFTGPVNILQHIAAKDLVSVMGDGSSIEYMGVLCMVLLTRKPLVPYYVVNIADQQLPFTGIIGMSNLVNLQETNGLHMTFLPKYVLSDDPLMRRSDAEIEKLFFDGLRIMFPDLKADDIVAAPINRAFKVQPLQVLNYSHLVPHTTAKNNDFFILNTAQLVQDNPNNNAVVRHVDRFLKENFL